MKEYDKNIQEKINSLANKQVPQSQWSSHKTWTKLNEKLEGENKSKKVISIYRNMVVAASLLLLLSLGLYLFLGKETVKEEGVVSNLKQKTNPMKQEKENFTTQSKIKQKKHYIRNIQKREQRQALLQKMNQSEVIANGDSNTFILNTVKVAKINLEENVEKELKYQVNIPTIKNTSLRQEEKQVITLAENVDTRKRKLAFKLDIALPKTHKKTKIKPIRKKKRKFKIQTNLNVKETEIAENNPDIVHLRIKIK